MKHRPVFERTWLHYKHYEYCFDLDVGQLSGHYLVCLSKPPCGEKDKERKAQLSLSLFSLHMPRKIVSLYLFILGWKFLSTCLLRVNKYSPDSCQLCPSTDWGMLVSTLWFSSNPPHLKQHCKERGLLSIHSSGYTGYVVAFDHFLQKGKWQCTVSCVFTVCEVQVQVFNPDWEREQKQFGMCVCRTWDGWGDAQSQIFFPNHVFSFPLPSLF